jgi:DNA-binding NarL/FixJ family response regulator
MILLIDDDPSFAGDLAALLHPRSDFVWTDRSDVGLKVIADERPAQILLDLNMPHRLAMLDEEEGIEVLRRLSPQERARVVIVTGGLSSMVRRQLEALGVARIYIKSEPMARLHALMGESVS